jgi:hypothetical protein
MFLLLAIVLPLIKAQDYNETVKALNQSRIDLQEMIDAGLNILRVNDTLSEAEQLFTAQSALIKENGTPDFSLILERTAEITELREQAEKMNDELKALEERIKEIKGESEAFAIFNKAKEEFADERYDNVAELVEDAYMKISEEQALQTRFRAIYEAGTKTVFDFFRRRWKGLTITIILISTIYLLFRKRVAIFLIDKKIENLNFEKNVLEKLIKKAQYEYFHLFKIPEELYHIRIEKFGELIRDIERQIPVLMEEKARVKGKVKKEEVEAEKVEKSYKELIIAFLPFLILIAAGISLIIYLKLIPYSKIPEFIQRISFNIKESLDFIIAALGLTISILAGLLILVILPAILAFIYVKKRKKAKPKEIEEKKQEKERGEEEKEEKEEEKRPGFFQSLQLSISNKINASKIYIRNSIKRIEEKKQYKKLLKQKEEEEKPTIKYLRKPKAELFKKTIKEKISSLAHPVKKGKVEEGKEPEAEVKKEEIKKKEVEEVGKEPEKEEKEEKPKEIEEKKQRKKLQLKPSLYNWKESFKQKQKKREEKRILEELQKRRQQSK